MSFINKEIEVEETSAKTEGLENKQDQEPVVKNANEHLDKGHDGSGDDKSIEEKDKVKLKEDDVKVRDEKSGSTTSTSPTGTGSLKIQQSGKGKSDYYKDRNRAAGGGDKGYNQHREDRSSKSDRRDSRGKEFEHGSKGGFTKKVEDQRRFPFKDKTASAKRDEKKDKESDRRKQELKAKEKAKEEIKKSSEEIKRQKEEKEKLEKERKAEEERKLKEEEKQRKEEEKKREEEERQRREEEAVRMREEEEKLARELEVEAKEKIAAKIELRMKNLNATAGRPEESFFGKLDSSLKKNTTFVKKLRTMTEQQRESLSSDFAGLNLTKYIGEAVTSVVEAKLKMSDVGCAVHISSLLHQRYAEYSPQLLQAFQKTLQKKDEKVTDPARMRITLRLLAELVVHGLFTDKEGLPLLANQISAIVNVDKETHSNISLILSFARHCGEDYAGLIPRKNSEQNFVYKNAKLDGVMGIDVFNPYNLSVEFDWDTSLWEDEDAKSFYENLVDLKAFVPGILFKDSEKVAELAEDTEEEELNDLDITDTETEDDDEEEAQKEVIAAYEEEKKIMEDLEYTAELEDIEEEETTGNMNMKILLEAFLQKLPTCVNREFIDQAAVEFCMNLNTKSNRKKLVKTLFLVPRTRLDLLPFYARLVATLYPCMGDIARDLVDKFKGDFRWHVRKKDQINLESKIKTVRFIGELTKFKMFPKTDTLLCLKMLLHDFSHHNIEMACNLLETCGRFLYRSPDSHLRTNALLEQMMRKKSKLHLNERQNTMVENAFFYCNPPEVKQEEKVVRPPMHEYIRKLLYKDLTKLNVEKVLRQIRKLPWDNKEIINYVTKCMTCIWNVKFNNIHCVASLLAGLVPYHEEIGIQVVDGVLEDIRIGMEINHPKYNQRRVSIVKYLGELYNYRMVESAVIFKELYTFITFGVNLEGPPTPLDPPEHLFRIRLVSTLLDTCGQYFDRGSSKRKLDCFLLYFQRYIWYKKHLDIWNPELHPFPIDIDYMISDTVEALRPKFKFSSNSEEANNAVRELEQEFLPKIAPYLPKISVSEDLDDASHPLTTIVEDDETTFQPQTECTPEIGSDGLPVITEIGEESDSDDESCSGRRRNDCLRGSGSQSQEGILTDKDDYDTDVLMSAGENEEDDQVHVLTGGPKHIKCDEDSDFLAAFDQMMAENLQHRNNELIKVPQLDVSVPVNLKTKLKVGDPLKREEVEKMHVDFVMITRKGNKQQLRTVQVPANSHFVSSVKTREEAEMAEKQRMKRLTLNINERQEEEDYQEMIAAMQRPTAVNTTRERKSKFQHPKGAPDADLIFKSGGRW
uniref:Regulator of nonsense transcripts 2-like n=1 Tax=Saccoglossus kowalevskii TaxID=10224 RepID=A0ABM0MFQ3_SACKO|nr:PREDICTED: regulator of nonsense transcripts 2-like [Saccoglossus kowalevskii]